MAARELDRVMGWIVSDWQEFESAGLALLQSDPLRNTVAMTILAQNRQGVYPSTWLRYERDGSVTGAVTMTDGFPLLLAVIPDGSLPELVEAVSSLELVAVNGDVETVREFARLWCERSGSSSSDRQGQRLFELDELTWPPLLGSHRLATAEDRDLVLEWWDAFGHEAETTQLNSAPVVDDRISYGGVVLWEVDGSVVALAGVSRVIEGMARIGPVYTPPASRRNGYAAMATAAATSLGIERGATTMCLFTDLANETTNRLYPRLGYRPVEDRLIISFS